MLDLASPTATGGPAARFTDALAQHGYCVIRNAMGIDHVERTLSDLRPHFDETPASVGAFYGASTRRFHALLGRSSTIECYVSHPLILKIARDILTACDNIQLNLTQAIQIDPGGEAQPPHRDQDMWPVHAPDTEYLINVMWPFTDYTAENGGTIIWPGSHRQLEQIVLPAEQAIVPHLLPGDALIFLGSTLHAGGANITNMSRRGMIISYSLGWLKPYELPWLAYPPEIARRFHPNVAALAGYRAHRPNLGTHEGRCPSYLLLQDQRGSLGAIDTLRPEQEALIAAYRRGDFDPSPEEPRPLFLFGSEGQG